MTLAHWFILFVAVLIYGYVYWELSKTETKLLSAVYAWIISWGCGIALTVVAVYA